MFGEWYLKRKFSLGYTAATDCFQQTHYDYNVKESNFFSNQGNIK